MQQIHHKKNELFQVEFFKDKECTEAFDFMDKKDLYIDGLKGDITPLLKLHDNIHTDDVNVCVVNITAPQILQFGKYICGSDEINGQGYGSPQSDTKYYFLNVSDYNDVFEGYAFDNFTNFTPNLSKYIPEDNAVLFLDGEKISLIDYDNYYDMFSGYRDIEFEGKIIKGMPYHPQIYGIHTIGDRVSVHKHEHGIDDYTNFTLNILKGKKLTIFLPHGTQSELQKANEVGKYLWENFGIKPDVFVLHCFLTKIVYGTVGYLCDKKKYMLSIKNKCFMDDIYCKDTSKLSRLNKDYDKEFIYYELDTLNGEFAEYINKIITTNSTGILKPEDSNERLQVIDCKEFFEEYLNKNNLI